MLVAIHQPEHLPWLGFFHKMKSVDVFVFLDDVQFRKNYFQNRNRILGSNGPQWVTVPVELRGHTGKTLREMKIDNQHRWQRKYWGSIVQSYGKHPYFKEYGSLLEEIINQPTDDLLPLNLDIIELFREALGVETPCIVASSLHLGEVSSSTEHLLRICQEVEATAYLSGPFGREYLDQDVFRRKRIEILFHEFTYPIYPQWHTEQFVPDLSALDLMCNSGPGAGSLLGQQVFNGCTSNG